MASRPSHLPALRTRRWEAMPSSGMLATAAKGPVKGRAGSRGQVMQGDSGRTALPVLYRFGSHSRTCPRAWLTRASVLVS
jgi:hypothetical protein